MMTDQHPLTDQKAMDLFSFERLLDPSQPDLTIEDTMRAAADWQLEQVFEWIERYPWVGSDCPIYDFEDKQDRSQLIADLKKAMRPQGES
jgi:hypothetical protein